MSNRLFANPVEIRRAYHWDNWLGDFRKSYAMSAREPDKLGSPAGAATPRKIETS
jgi:hypothetical protein